MLHCDVGITVARLNTDTQHDAYVLLPGETDAPGGLSVALANANALQDIVMGEIRPGRTGNEILAASLARMRAQKIDGTIYSHPIGMHGHGAGPLIGLWDYQDGVPGRGDAKVIPTMWFSIELQATTPVPEWGGQAVRMAQEEDAIVGADGKVRWALRRQDGCSWSARAAPATCRRLAPSVRPPSACESCYAFSTRRRTRANRCGQPCDSASRYPSGNRPSAV